ncbi:MAG: hypothetical protein HKP25_13075 [Marinicaulis sp.]|nr:hypothetical protein [Marinicaulis sp.]NNL89993.1 hypothetical protein [Marinicaulis sp.]
MALRTTSLAAKPVVKYVGVAAAAIMLQACGTMQKSNSAGDVGKDEYREAIGVYTNQSDVKGMDPIAAAAFWGTRYNTNQSDPAVAVNYSQSLRKIGSLDEAVTVMKKTEGHAAADPDVSLEYGKVLVESGRAFEAVRHLENAVAAKPTDWTAISAYGVALDQIGEHEAARQSYKRALAVSPGNVSVLNNKGLSYALDGKLSMASNTLREAAAKAGGDARIRQNLALVLALAGDMGEAERLARSDLPPRVANNNIDYFRQLMNQPAYWGEYAANDADVPDFDAAPLAPTPKVEEAPKPQLREEPKVEEPEVDKDAPIALMEVAPVTNASAEVDENDDAIADVLNSLDVDVDEAADDVEGVSLKSDN